MTDISTILTIILTLYALAMGVFLISENRSPQATLAASITNSRQCSRPIDGGVVDLVHDAFGDGEPNPAQR
jgi:hypothetical protein